MTEDLHSSSLNTALIVAKFGGSSVADAAQIKKLAEIVRSDSRRRFIVVSAAGKRSGTDKKITDLLYLCHSLHEQGLDMSTAFNPIEDRYREIARELHVESVEEWLSEIKTEISEGTYVDWIVSRGEYLSAKIIAAYLNAEFVDAIDGIRFGTDGRLHAAETYARLEQRLGNVPDSSIAVIPGFYGRDNHGNIRCFSRGGSDVTGAIIARSVKASVYENWTDVSGMLMADPRVVENPKPISTITYREQRELSYMGASVLHDEAVFPVREAGIPIRICNTNRPQDPGTQIVTSRDSTGTSIVGVAGKTGFVSLFTEKALMNQERGYGRKVLEILESHGLNYEHSPTSIDTLSVIIAEEEIAGKEAQVISDIKRQVEPDRIELQRDLAMVAVVGQGMVHRVGMAAHVFRALAEKNINIRMINQGSSELNIIVGINAQDYETAVRAIYATFAADVQTEPITQ